MGKALVQAAEDELIRLHGEIWLETERDSRAAGFYQHLGWAPRERRRTIRSG